MSFFLEERHSRYHEMMQVIAGRSRAEKKPQGIKLSSIWEVENMVVIY